MDEEEASAGARSAPPPGSKGVEKKRSGNLGRAPTTWKRRFGGRRRRARPFGFELRRGQADSVDRGADRARRSRRSGSGGDRAAGRQDHGDRHDRRETAITHSESDPWEVARELARRSGVAEVQVERSAFGLAHGPARWGCEPDEVANPPPIDALARVRRDGVAVAGVGEQYRVAEQALGALAAVTYLSGWVVEVVDQQDRVPRPLRFHGPV